MEIPHFVQNDGVGKNVCDRADMGRSMLRPYKDKFRQDAASLRRFGEFHMQSRHVGHPARADVETGRETSELARSSDCADMGRSMLRPNEDKFRPDGAS